MQGILGGDYQGNRWWAFLLVGLIGLFVYALCSMRLARTNGKPSDPRQMWFLFILVGGFAGLALYQIFSHPW